MDGVSKELWSQKIEQGLKRDSLDPLLAVHNSQNGAGTSHDIHSPRGRQDVDEGSVAAYQDYPWSSQDESIIREPYNYVAGLPSKEFRAHLIAALNAWLKVPERSLQTIANAIGMLHNASLLIDDIEDASDLRRGYPSAHTVFGIAQTINSGNYMYFQAQRELQSLENQELMIVFLDELLNLHRGQGLDLYWRDSLLCPTEREYLGMVKNKTGGLFRLAFRLMLVESSVQQSASASEEMILLLETMSMAFQVLDDYQNLRSTLYTLTKGFAEDLTEGKFSFPVISSIHADPSNRMLQNILRLRTTNDAIKGAAIQFIEKTGGFDRTREMLRRLRQSAYQTLSVLEETGEVNECCAPLRKILAKLEITT